MKIFLIILLILALILTIIMRSSLVVEAEFWDGKFQWAVKYFGFKLFPTKEKEKDEAEEARKEAEKKQKKAEKKAKEKEEKAAEKRRRLWPDRLARKLEELWGNADMVSDILAASPGMFRRFAKGMTLDRIETDIVVANDDAADCAITYGRIQIALQNLLAQLGRAIRVKRKRVSIICDFAADKSRFDMRARLKIRVGSTLWAAICFGCHYLWHSRKMAKLTENRK